MEFIGIDEITAEVTTQSRAAINATIVDEYATDLKAKVEFPPVVVFHDDKKYWLADGFHRIRAYQQAGLSKIPCDVREGTLDQAKIHASGANIAHGMRRTPADKRRAVMLLLSVESWRTVSARAVADQCGVDHKTVTQVMSELESKGMEFPKKVNGKDGKTRTRTPASRKLSTKPKAEKRELTDEQTKVAKAVRESHKPEKHKYVDGPRHTFKGSEAEQLYNIEHVRDMAAEFKISGPDAARRYHGRVRNFSIDNMRQAAKFMSEFVAEWDRLESA